MKFAVCLLLIAALLVLGFAGVRVSSSGTYGCRICGLTDVRRTRMGITTASAPLPTPYTRWFDKEVHLPHSHDWTPITGIHENSIRASTIYCCEPPALMVALQAALPSLPDQVLARHIAAWLARASAPDRRAEFALDLEPAWPQRALGLPDSAGAPPSPESMEEARREWSARSPLARAVFAPALR